MKSNQAARVAGSSIEHQSPIFVAKLLNHQFIFKAACKCADPNV